MDAKRIYEIMKDLEGKGMTQSNIDKVIHSILKVYGKEEEAIAPMSEVIIKQANENKIPIIDKKISEPEEKKGLPSEKNIKLTKATKE